MYLAATRSDSDPVNAASPLKNPKKPALKNSCTATITKAPTTWADVARQLDIPYDTLRKAIDQGRLGLPDLPADRQHEAESPAASATIAAAPSDKSTRSTQDQGTGQEMGIACTRPIERVLAALGKLPGGASTQFEPCRDVSYGGVLCALPALAENGLFRHLRSTFPTLTGYYTTLHVILLLAYMALCRIRVEWSLTRGWFALPIWRSNGSG